MWHLVPDDDDDDDDDNCDCGNWELQLLLRSDEYDDYYTFNTATDDNDDDVTKML